MPRFIRFETAKNAKRISRTNNNKAFIVETDKGKINYYPNSSYNNSVICSARRLQTKK